MSPSNKHGVDRESYLRKRNRVISKRAAHWVEIDLTRSGDRPAPPPIPDCDYYALVSRTHNRDAVAVWPIGLRDPLPVLPIALRHPDADVRLDRKLSLDRTEPGPPPREGECDVVEADWPASDHSKLMTVFRGR